MSMDWDGSLTDGDDIVKGKIKIPNLSEENEPEDITVSHDEKCCFLLAKTFG